MEFWPLNSQFIAVLFIYSIDFVKISRRGSTAHEDHAPIAEPRPYLGCSTDHSQAQVDSQQLQLWEDGDFFLEVYSESPTTAVLGPAVLLFLPFPCLCLLHDLLYVSITPRKRVQLATTQQGLHVLTAPIKTITGEIRGKMEKDQQNMVIKRILMSCFLMIFFVHGVTLGALKDKTTNSALLFS